MSRLQMRKKVGVKFTGGTSASPADLAKDFADKRMIINVDCPSDTSTVDINVHDHMNPEKP